MRPWSECGAARARRGARVCMCASCVSVCVRVVGERLTHRSLDLLGLVRGKVGLAVEQWPEDAEPKAEAERHHQCPRGQQRQRAVSGSHF